MSPRGSRPARDIRHSHERLLLICGRPVRAGQTRSATGLATRQLPVSHLVKPLPFWTSACSFTRVVTNDRMTDTRVQSTRRRHLRNALVWADDRLRIDVPDALKLRIGSWIATPS